MLLAALALLAGLVLLVWSADRFVLGAAGLAARLGLPPLLIGMVIVGFGTSAPELVVSVMAALEEQPDLAIGNAYGSNIANIGLILGLTALVAPISVSSSVLRRELPILVFAMVVPAFQLSDGHVGRSDAIVLLTLFAGLMGWSVLQARNGETDPLVGEVDQAMAARSVAPGGDVAALAVGLVVPVGSSRLLVWGAVEIATGLGISELVVGLTVVAIGTSLPELASSLAAIRRREHGLALVNVIGSNLFNTLAVVGLAGVLHPFAVGTAVLYRDVSVMAAMTLLLLFFALGRGGAGTIGRWDGAFLLAGFVAYTTWLLRTALTA